jgi:glycosyltransferase involved in cell wall biosynthesis
MKLLIVDISQFGYHTDAYYYARHLSRTMDVSYIGCHQGKKELDPGNVNVIHVPCKGNKLVMHYYFFRACIREMRKNNYDCVFICYTVFCSILRILFPGTTMVVDIRTGYVEPSKLVNTLFNGLLKLEVACFKNVTFISKELADYLGFKREYTVLPVGAERIETIPAVKSDKIALLCVGIFTGRKIDVTIRGFKMFLDSYDQRLPVTYTLIGFGADSDIQKVKNEIMRLGLSDRVEFKGEIRQPEVGAYFLNASIGVSFVPVKPIYDCQPPTKNYEYMMYGMPVLATATKFNKDFIKPELGVVTSDTETGFCEGLKEIVSRLGSFDPLKIRQSAGNFSYEKIVGEIVSPYILSRSASS